jgi:hypothetical protein
MSGKMNWDRVRKDDLSLAHGSEWIGPLDSGVDSTGRLHSKSKAKAKTGSVRPFFQSLPKRMESVQELTIRRNAYIAKFQSDLFIGEYRLRINPVEIRVFRGDARLGRSKSKAVIRAILGPYVPDCFIRSLRGRSAEGIEETLNRYLPKNTTWRVVASNGRS